MIDDADPNYDPTLDPSRKRKKSQSLNTSKRSLLLDFLQRRAKEISECSREKVTWADAFMKKKKEKLFDFQCESVDEAFTRYRRCENFSVFWFDFFFVSKIPGLLICDEPGLGKTITSCGILGNLKSYDPEFKAFVMVKKNILDQWLLELSKWTALKVITLPPPRNERV